MEVLEKGSRRHEWVACLTQPHRNTLETRPRDGVIANVSCQLDTPEKCLHDIFLIAY